MRSSIRALSPHLGRWVGRDGLRASRLSSAPALCPHCQRRARLDGQTGRRGLSTSRLSGVNQASDGKKTTSLGNSARIQDAVDSAQPATDEIVVAGGTEGEHAEESEEDALAYERAREEEKRQAYQLLVDRALDDPQYRPSSTGQGLQRIGGEFDFEPPERPSFDGFLPTEKINDVRELQHVVHRAAVEVYAALSEDLPVNDLPWTAPELLFESDAWRVRLMRSRDGRGASLQYPSQTVKEDLLLSVNEEALAEKEAEAEADLERELSDSSETAGLQQTGVTPPGDASEDEVAARSDETGNVLDEEPAENASRLEILDKTQFGKEWHDVPILSLAVKLALCKRIMQLSGQVIPDPVVHSVQSLGDITAYLCRKATKPISVFESIVGSDTSQLVDEDLYLSRGNASRNFSALAVEDQNALTSLPNVVISDRRVSMVDKERSLGRWKLMEEELQRRNLPLLGEHEQRQAQRKSNFL